MNRLNKTEPVVFLCCRFSILFPDYFGDIAISIKENAKIPQIRRYFGENKPVLASFKQL